MVAHLPGGGYCRFRDAGGATGILLFPQASTVHQVFVAFVLAGMVAGAVGMCSSVLVAFVAFSVPALVPLIVRFFLMGDDLHLAMGGMTFLFLILTSQSRDRSTVRLPNWWPSRSISRTSGGANQ
jgi:hypothetical protein